MEQFQNLKQQLQETVRQRMDMSSELSDAQIGEIIESECTSASSLSGTEIE